MSRARPLLAAMALAGLAAACAPKGGGESAEALKAELPAPYNTGDVKAGKLVFVQCSACHNVTKDGSDMTGPNLYGVFGSKAGTRREKFAYTAALKATGWTWDAPTLDKWVAGPQAAVPGTKMVFPGLTNPQDRINLIAYLKVASSGGPS